MTKLKYRVNKLGFILLFSLILTVVLLILLYIFQLVIGKVQAKTIIEIGSSENNEVQVVAQYEKYFKRTYSQFFISSGVKDYRAIVFDEYFRINNSPLFGQGTKIVESCISVGAPSDCIILVGIARVETDLCKYLPSQSIYNCWGFGGSGENRYSFLRYEDAIELIYKRLASGYGNDFMSNPEIGEMAYCGWRESCRTWGDRVIESMYDVNNLSIQLGFGPLL